MSNTQHFTDRLSEFLDNRLSDAERARVEAHLETCERCQRDVAELRYTMRVVRALPAMRAPRSYTLTSAQASPGWSFSWLYQTLRGATVVAAILFAAVLSADLFGLGSGSRVALQPAAAPAPSVVSGAGKAAESNSDATRAQPPAAPTSAPAAAQQRATTAASAPLPTQSTATARPPAAAAATAPPAQATASAPSPAQPSTSGVITSTTPTPPPPTATPSPSATATAPPTQTPTASPSATPSASATASAAPAPTTTPSEARASAPTPDGVTPLRLAEVGLAAFALFGLVVTLWLRAARPR